MKKIVFYHCMRRILPSKLLLMGKLSFICFFSMSMLSYGRSFPQAKLTLKMENVTLKKALLQLHKESKIKLLFSEDLIHKNTHVSIFSENRPFKEILSQLLFGTGLDFKIIDSNQIAIVPYPAAQFYQDSTKGYVKDNEGKPLEGATIVEKGTTNGTTTDSAGYFFLSVKDENAIIVISRVGFKTVEFSAHSPNLDNVSLIPSSKDLNTVVVVGYSNQKKSDLTSAITVVSSDKLKDVTTNDIGSMLQGKVSGLQVVSSSGAPGASAEIRIRGVSSVNASQKPLYVVDGIIGGNYDPNDVENITVLKDASATSMYGSQANAGVIIVTTKKAAMGKTRLELKVSTGFRKPDFGSMKMMTGAQLYEHQKEYYRDYTPGADDNSYKVDLLQFYSERPLSLKSQNYSWLNTMFKNAPITNVYLSASGRTEKNDYYWGLTYYDEKGTLLNTQYKRINLRANSTHYFTPKISVTNNINLSGSLGTGYDYNDIYYAYLNMPWDNPYDSTGSPIYVDGNSTFKWWSRDKTNPLHTINNSSFPNKGFDLNYDLNLNIGITNWLSFNSTNRVAAAYSKSKTYYSPLAEGTYYGTGYLDEENTLTYGYISNDLFKFNFHLGDHSLTGLAGFATEGSHTELSGASGKGLPTGYNVLNVVSTNQTVDGSNDKSMLASFISQINYGYKNKYFFTASYRLDGSSNFPSDNRYAPFHALSASWLVNRESFLENSNVIDLLKLRASYGVTGSQDIGSSKYLGLYSLSSQYNSATAAVPTQLPSSNLTWESKYQWNVGIDLGLFKRVELTVDAYSNLTKNLLLQVSQPLSVGFETRWENTGEISNKGIELGLNTTNIQSKDFSWLMNFNISFNTNKLKKFPATTINTQSTWSISQIYRNGGNLYEFYMPKWLGVDNQTGAPLWEKVTTDEAGKTIREATSTYSDATYQEVGSPLPKYQGGWTNTFKYKDLTLSFNTYFLYGNKVFSNSLRFVENDGTEPYYNQIVLPKGYSVWTKPGDIATEPSPQNATNSTQTSTRYLKDGSFISIRNITLSYTFPKAYAKRLGLNDILVGLSADNVYTFTKFLGQDPQTTLTPGTYVMPGVSDFKYPNNRQYLFNIDFRF